MICVELLVQTRKSRNVKVLEYVRACRLIHRTDFMKDRSLYDARRGFAAKKPKEALSLITDGMQQTHCELPYSANRYPHSNKLKQHLQGITCHGRRTKMYRTFDNLPLGSNLCIYTLLYEIEEELKMNGCLPKILYIQIDGGSENANYAVLAWMEILIWLDVGVEEIWVCRMRTGHNHADQDAKFGIVWRTARTRVLLTPQHYEKMIAEALKSECVVDIMAVPDLVGAVESFVDPSLRHAFKGVYTQHVFRFQKAPISSRFPLGARCTYRASALDYFYEFVNNPLSPIGISPRKVMVEWQPEDGIRFMTSAPPFDFLDHIQTQEFVEGSTRKMRNIVHMIKSSNTKSRNDYNIHVERDYNEFLEGIPLSDESSEAFLSRVGRALHVPFQSRISFRRPESSADQDADKSSLFESDICLPTVAAGACVRWSGCLKPEAPRVTIQGRSDATEAEQKIRRKVKSRASEIDINSINPGIIHIYEHRLSKTTHIYIKGHRYLFQQRHGVITRNSLGLISLRSKLLMYEVR